MQFNYGAFDKDALDEPGEWTDPVLVEKDDLTEWKVRVEQADELEDGFSHLKEIQEENSELKSENKSLESKLEHLSAVKKSYAEAVATDSPFDTEELMEMEFDVLKAKAEALDVEENEDSTPDPKGGDVDEEELEGDDGDDVPDEEIEQLEEKLEWYDTRGWDDAAESVRSELSELKDD